MFRLRNAHQLCNVDLRGGLERKTLEWLPETILAETLSIRYRVFRIGSGDRVVTRNCGEGHRQDMSFPFSKTRTRMLIAEGGQSPGESSTCNALTKAICSVLE